MNIFYQSFLLRMWITDGLDYPTWHASLEDPHTRMMTLFHDPEALFEFLRGLSKATEKEGESESQFEIKEGKENE